MQGNTVQGRIHWWTTNWAVPRLLSGIETGVIEDIRRRRRLVLPGTPAGLNMTRGASDVQWGRMTVYPAAESTGIRILSETMFFATQFGGRTSTKITRRVERNPV